jgi:hypothetical protein
MSALRNFKGTDEFQCLRVSPQNFLSDILFQKTFPRNVAALVEHEVTK